METDRVAKLQQHRKFLALDQHEGYAIVLFSGGVDGMALRAIFDPHIFILQLDNNADQLEINFNPTEQQIEALRKLRARIKIPNFK